MFSRTASRYRSQQRLMESTNRRTGNKQQDDFDLETINQVQFSDFGANYRKPTNGEIIIQSAPISTTTGMDRVLSHSSTGSSQSLSTNSSISTVLEASTMNSNNNNNNKLIRPITKTRTTTSISCRPGSSIIKISSERELSSDEDELSGTCLDLSSASSSTSSSSGLSSMNSSSSSSSSSDGHPMAELAEPSGRQVSRRCGSGGEVGICLSDLVELVADERQSPTNCYRQQQQQQPHQMAASSDSKSHFNLKHEAHLVRAFSVTWPSKFHESQPVEQQVEILRLASDCITRELHESEHESAPGELESWIVGLRADKSLIEWQQIDTLDGHQIGNTERVEFGHILNCLVEQQVVVWLLKCCSTEGFNSAGLEAANSPGSSEKKEEEEVVILVWLCLNVDEARWFRDTYRFLATANERQQSSPASQPLAGSCETEPTGEDDKEEEVEDVEDSLNHPGEQQQQQSKQIAADTKPSGGGQKAGAQSYESCSKSSRSSDYDEEAFDRDDANQQVTVPESSPAAGDCRLEAHNGALESDSEPVEIETSKGEDSRRQEAESESRKVGLLNSKDKRDKKAVSGLDLSRSSSGGAGSGLASFYRSVASKVFMNGQSKMKSFRLGMNNRLGRSRISLADTGHLAAPAIGEKSPPWAGEGGNKLVSGARDEPRNGHKDSERRERNPLQDSLKASLPEAKPRTSILKSKQQQQQQQQYLIGCDMSENERFPIRQSPGDAVVNAANAHKPTKSILKSSKSIGNMENIPNESNHHHHLAPKRILKANKCEEHSSGYPNEPIKLGHLSGEALELDTRERLRQRANHQVARYNQAVDRRRSTYSLAVEDDTQLEHSRVRSEEDDEDQVGLSTREMAFERIKQRASCYDITRLMSKNGAPSKLGHMRSGSINLAPVKSRQRQPALLIETGQGDSGDSFRGRERGREHSSGEDSRLSSDDNKNAPEQKSRSRNVSEFDPRTLRQVTAERISHRPPVRPISVALDGCQVNSDDSETDEGDSTGGAAAAAATGKPSLSKSGPFSLLRQSFNQKTISSMLRFSARGASMRIKQSNTQSVAKKPTESHLQTGGDQLTWHINELTAKECKSAQTAKIKQCFDPNPIVQLAATQFNHHHHQQQQQLLHQYHAQQQFARSNHLFDHHHHQQMLIQRHQRQQQQQHHHHHQRQLTYMASLNSAHYLAQQMATFQPVGAGPGMIGPAAPLVYLQPAAAQPVPQVTMQQLSNHRASQRKPNNVTSSARKNVTFSV